MSVRPRLPPPPRARPPVRVPDPALLAAWLMAGAFAVAVSGLAMRRHDAFWTGRFDLGNMVQAVWSTAQGRPLETTDVAGRQFVRLGSHVDPVLMLLAPVWRLWPSPDMLLVVQAAALALGAIPVFWLGRRWLGHDGLALAGVAAYLLYPPLLWSSVSEFHAVTLATPLLLYCIWAVEEDRPVVLAVCAPLAVLTKEQVGLAVAMLGLWAAVAHGRRLLGAVLAAGGVAWTVLAVAVLIPHFSPGGAGSPFARRYAELGDGEGEVLRTVLTRPWEAVEIAVRQDRIGYLLALLLPLLLLPLAAPLLAAGALPDLLLNVLADYWPQYSVEYQYTAVITPFLVAAALRGLARLRGLDRPRPLVALLERPAVPGAALVGAVLVAGWHMGPLPLWSSVPGGSDYRVWEFDVTPHSRVMAQAAARIPGGVPVSAANPFGAHLSDRERILTWPVIGDARYVIVDERRPFLADRYVRPSAQAPYLARMRADARFRIVFARDGVLVFQRRPAPRTAPRP